MAMWQTRSAHIVWQSWRKNTPFAIPFYVAAPLSTIDRTIDSGTDIPIEQRPAEEVRQVGIQQIVDPAVEVENPAFDVTPARYIRGIITETGVALPPNRDSIAALFA
jgi:methylthioribose-1-phosphate isomerase